MSDRLAEVTARHDAATRGPWRWTGNTTGSGNLFLMALDKWRHIVMGFQRGGMRSAQPTFRVDGIMVKAQELHVCPEDHNPWRVTGLNHPDAVAIERSWEDIDYLLAEVERLQRLLCDLTPGGSEFAGSPDRCAAWAENEISSRLQMAVRAKVEQRNAEDKVERLQQELDRRDVWQAWAQGKLPTEKADYQHCHCYMDQHGLFGDEHIEWQERGKALVEEWKEV